MAAVTIPSPNPRSKTRTSGQVTPSPAHDLKHFVQAYLAHVSGLSPNTQSKYKQALNHFLWWLEFDNRPLRVQEALNPFVIEEFFQYMRVTHRNRWGSRLKQANRPMSESSVHAHAQGLRAFSGWLANWGYIAANPFREKKVAMPRPRKVAIEPFTAEQLRAMLTCCDPFTEHGSRNHAMILLLVDTGMRAQELCSLLFEDFNFDTGKVRIRRGKGDKERYVVASPTTIAAVFAYTSRYRPPNVVANLFISRSGSNERGELSVRGLDKMLAKLGKTAGIYGVRVSAHTFRHTFALWWLNNGGDAITLQNLLGHDSLAMTRRYVNAANLNITELHKKHSPVAQMKLK